MEQSLEDYYIKQIIDLQEQVKQLKEGEKAFINEIKRLHKKETLLYNIKVMLEEEYDRIV